MLLRLEERPSFQSQRWSRLVRGTPLLLVALIVPNLLQCLLALGLHTTLAFAHVGKAFALPRFGEVRLISPWLSDERTLMHTYLASIEDGAHILQSLREKPTKVLVPDFANPFSAGLNLQPPHGDSAWLHWGRNINGVHFIPPERLFADVEILMLPKWGINNIPLRALYQASISTAFEPMQETDCWTIYRRKEQEVATTPPGAAMIE